MFGELCVRCKTSRNLCGLSYCPLLDHVSDLLPKIKLNKTELFGQAPPSVFVGRYKYPNVYAGPMVSELNKDIGGPENWYGMSMVEVALKTSSLVRPATVVNVRRVADRNIEVTKEIAMSSNPVDTEITLSKPYVDLKSTLDLFIHPMGPKLEMKKITLAQNPSIPRRVDHIVSDTDLLAGEAVISLYKSEIPFSHIQRILSVGLLGKEYTRKMVPTRWSITATDDIIGKELIKEIKNYQLIDEFRVFYNHYVGNSFFIFLIPRIWSFEMLELWQKGSFFTDVGVGSGDFEGYSGRKNYAENVAGAYYSARLAVLEYLKKIERQSSVLVYREVGPEYSIPLGVWVIRESVRNAMKEKYESYEDLDNAILATFQRTRVKDWAEKSRLIKIVKTQRTLDYRF